MLPNPLLTCKNNLNLTFSSIAEKTGLARYSLYQWSKKTDPKDALNMTFYTHLTLLKVLGVDFLGWYEKAYPNVEMTKWQIKSWKKKQRDKGLL